MTANIYSRPILPLVAAMMTGIAFGSVHGGHRTWILTVCAAIFARLIYCIVRRKANAGAPLLLFAGLGYLLIQPWAAPVLPEHHVVHYTDGKKWRISGSIDTQPLRRDNRTRFILNVDTLSDASVSYPVTGKIRVTVSAATLDLRRGDQVALFGKIRSIRNFNNPGGFDYKEYMRYKNVWGSAYSREEDLVLVAKASRYRLSGRIDTARLSIAGRIEKTGQGDHTGVLKALLIGDRSGISPLLREAFHRSGIGHLLAISGLHIGIVASVAFLSFSWLFSRFDALLWKARTRIWAAIFAFVPALFYALLAGMSPSTQRAIVMVGVLLLTYLINRDQDVMNTLAVAAMVILIFDPPALFSISFQLSFLAVFAIIFGLSRLNRDGHPPPNSVRAKVTTKMTTFFLVSVFATLGTLPVVMHYFNQVSLIGGLSNFIFVPIIGFAVVPLGLLSVFTLPISEVLSAWIMQIAADVLQVALRWVTGISAMPAAAVKTITPSLLEIGCYYFLLWAIIELLPLPIDRSATAEGTTETNPAETSTPGLLRRLFRRLMTKRQWAAIVLICGVLVLGSDVGYWIYQRFGRDDLRVTIIDVGQGSAALLELPGGYCVLADGGGFSNNEVFDVGARIVAPFLWHKKIKTVETLILSHPNSDHLNGLIYIAEHFHVKNIWTNDEKRGTHGYQNLMEIIERKHILRPRFIQLPRQTEINGVRFTIMHPAVDFLDKSESVHRQAKVNNNSLVFKAALGETSFLFTGDIMAHAEKEIIDAAGDKIASTVMVIPHHGSISSSTLAFINSVRPQIGVISAGWKNRFKFPHPQVMERYRQSKVRVYRTDRQGAVILVTDGIGLSVDSYITDG